MTAFVATVEPLIHFVHFSGQRHKDPRRLGVNSLSVITQRVHVLTYCLVLSIDYTWCAKE